LAHLFGRRIVETCKETQTNVRRVTNL